MAYIDQETKKLLSPGIQAVLKKYGVHGTIGVRDRRTLVVTLARGKLDFCQAYNRSPINGASINVYHISTSPELIRPFLQELLAAMNQGNHDRSDAQRDHFDVGWYNEIVIGRVDKPYELIS